MDRTDLVNLLNRAAAALETGSTHAGLTPTERAELIEDLTVAAEAIEKEREAKDE